MLQLALIWFIAYIPAQNAVAFWKEFAIGERGMSDGEAGLAISIAAVGSMPFVFLSGHLIDRIGRRRGAAVVFMLGFVGIIACYTLHGQWALTAALMLGIFAASAYLPILNSYASELFPTEYRGTAGAWSNNLLGRMGYVLSPIAVGALVESTGAYGPVVAPLAIFNLLALFLVYRFLPETVNKELEATANESTANEDVSTF
jgi:putative MFS transporter